MQEPTALPAPHRSRGALPSALTSGLLTGVALLAGCNGTSTPHGGHSQVGSIQYNDEAGNYFIVDQNDEGLSAEPRVARVMWGRLTDVFALDSVNERVLLQEDFVIDPDIETDGTDFELTVNSVTQTQELTILRNFDDTSQGGGRDQYFALLKVAEANLRPVFDKGFNQSGTYTMVPRNATIVFQLDDLYDPTTLDETTVKVLVGKPTIVPFEARVLPDMNHGDVANFDGVQGREFYPTRILVDMTVSEIESFEFDPPLPVNNVGMPASVEANSSTVQIRIPTVANPPIGQDHVLTNPSEHPLTSKDNGTVDFGSPTLDITRLARSGGDTNQTSDPYNGFLRDDVAPQVIGQLAVALLDAPISTNPPPAGDGTEFTLPLVQFVALDCAITPDVGDILEQPGIFAEVIEVPAPPVNGILTDLRVRLLVWPTAWDELDGPLEWEQTGIGSGQYLLPFNPAVHDSQKACFVKFSPVPTGYPGDLVTGVYPTANVTVRFSEPMDDGAMSAADSLYASRVATPTAGRQYIPGTVQTSVDLLEFTFLPDLPFSHTTGSSESYWIHMGEGPLGPIDLAGNEITDALPRVKFTLEPSATGLVNSGRVSRFSSADEEDPIADPNADPPELAPLTEWGGQIAFNLQRQSILPRSVTRFEGIADRTQTMVQVMNSNVAGNQVPLTNFGAKMQSVWRHEDMGLPLLDDTTYNIDIEGLNWSPLGGQAVVDSFDRFEIRVNHSSRYPDEIVVNFPPPLPVWPQSGVLSLYEKNFLNPILDPQKVLHRRSLGYNINPGSVYLSGSNTKMIPFPLNEGDPDDFEYWTWRDTSVLDRAGEDGIGIPSQQWWTVVDGNGLPQIVDCAGTCPGSMMPPWIPTFGVLYDPGEVQSIALPMLLEFRTWPDTGAIGNNRFDTSIVTNVSTQPYFRAFSAGGINTNLETVLVDPDLETVANGGFNPNSFPNPGEKTFGLDNEYYIGSVDFVVRVSRAFSVWFPVVTGDGQVFLNAKFYEPVMEPSQDEQPIGTTITAAFRGATTITGPFPPDDANDKYADIKFYARRMDLYGDHYPTPSAPNQCPTATATNHDSFKCGTQWVNQPVAFNNNDDTWHEDPSDINNAGYYQVRLTFTSNAETGLIPELATFGFSWSK